MAGVGGGTVVVAGDSGTSLLIDVQSQQHFMTISAEYLDIFKAWIDAGALDNEGIAHLKVHFGAFLRKS